MIWRYSPSPCLPICACVAGERRPTGSRALARGLRRALGGLRSRRSQRDAARAQLREAEAKYRTLVEQLPLVTYIDAITATATALYASPQVETLLGYTVEEWLADPEFFPKLLHPGDRERVLAHVEHCNATGDLFRLDYRLLARDGRTVWVQDGARSSATRPARRSSRRATCSTSPSASRATGGSRPSMA